MTKPLTHMYQIHYEDNSSRVIDWTKAEFEQVKENMVGGLHVAAFSDGVFKLDHVRAIVKLVPEEPVT